MHLVFTAPSPSASAHELFRIELLAAESRLKCSRLLEDGRSASSPAPYMSGHSHRSSDRVHSYDIAVP
jgi:hypothetical protein